jgi:uncharacterized membrane protein YkvA (DUF1232 family)
MGPFESQTHRQREAAPYVPSAMPKPRSALKVRRRAGMLSMLRHPGAVLRLLTDERAPTAPRVVAVLTILYVLMPIDLIPDVVPVLGWLDDLGFTGLAIGYVLSQAAKYEALRAREDDGPHGALPRPSAS